MEWFSQIVDRALAEAQSNVRPARQGRQEGEKDFPAQEMVAALANAFYRFTDEVPEVRESNGSGNGFTGNVLLFMTTALKALNVQREESSIRKDLLIIEKRHRNNTYTGLRLEVHPKWLLK